MVGRELAYSIRIHIAKLVDPFECRNVPVL